MSDFVNRATLENFLSCVGSWNEIQKKLVIDLTNLCNVMNQVKESEIISAIRDPALLGVLAGFENVGYLLTTKLFATLDSLLTNIREDMYGLDSFAALGKN